MYATCMPCARPVYAISIWHVHGTLPSGSGYLHIQQTLKNTVQSSATNNVESSVHKRKDTVCWQTARGEKQRAPELGPPNQLWSSQNVGSPCRRRGRRRAFHSADAHMHYYTQIHTCSTRTQLGVADGLVWLHLYTAVHLVRHFT